MAPNTVCETLRLRTSVAGGPFTGDYRAQSVNYVEMDVRTTSPDWTPTGVLVLGNDDSGDIVTIESNATTVAVADETERFRWHFNPCTDNINLVADSIVQYIGGNSNPSAGWESVIAEVDWIGVIFAEDTLSLCQVSVTSVEIEIDNISVGFDTSPPMSVSCRNPDHDVSLVTTEYAPCGSPNGGGLRVRATGGPPNEFAFLLVSKSSDSIPNPVGDGVICLGGPQGRYNSNAGTNIGPEYNSIGQFDFCGTYIRSPGVNPWFDAPIDLPNPVTGSYQAGESIYLQMWHRLPDQGQGPDSGLSNAIRVDMYSTLMTGLGLPTDIQVTDIPGNPLDSCDWYRIEGPNHVAPGDRRPLLVVFHQSGDGSGDLMNHTVLFEEAVDRGWFVIKHDGGQYAAACPSTPMITDSCVPQAPASGRFITFGTDGFLTHTDAVLADVLERFGHVIDTNRIYGYGFSMGANELLTYASRRQDPTNPMFAAVFAHSPANTQWQDHCQSFLGCFLGLDEDDYDPATSDENRYVWERANPFVIFDSSPLSNCTQTVPIPLADVDSDRTLVANIESLPTGVFYNDMEGLEYEMTSEFVADLLSSSATLTRGIGMAHNYGALLSPSDGDPTTPDVDTVFDVFESGGAPVQLQPYLDSKRLSGSVLIAEDNRRYFHFSCTRTDPTDFARLTWLAGPPNSNLLTITASSAASPNISDLTLHAEPCAPFTVLDTQQSMTIDLGFSLNSMEISGFESAPTSVSYMVSGTPVPFSGWSISNGVVVLQLPPAGTIVID